MPGDLSDSRHRTVSSDWHITGEPDWDELVRARTQYFTQRARLFSPAYDPVPLLRAVLVSRSTGHIAVQELGEMAEHRPDLIRALIPELFSYSLGVNPICGTARRALGVLSAEDLEPKLRPLVAEFLADPAHEWEEFSGLVMLLEDLGIRDLLEQVKTVARGSSNQDVRDVANPP
jgi:hypothetical protein